MMGGYGYGYGPMMGGWGWGGWLLMGFFWLLVIAGIVMLIVWMARGPRHRMMMGQGGPMHMQGPNDEALAIAKRRLANGEISSEQYEQIRKTLEGQ